MSFIEEHQDSFERRGTDYVLTAAVSKNTLERYFEKLAADEIIRCCRPFDVLHPEYMFLIGGCDPKCNMLLKYKLGGFPEKLSRLLDSDRSLKYVLAEKGINVDIEAFNSAFDSVFEKFFKSRKRLISAIGAGRANFFMIRHRSLDCYSVFKILKYAYGKSNCVNVYSEMFAFDRKCLVAINDLIDRYSRKSLLNSDPDFKRAISEVKLYADGCIAGVNNGI